MGSIFVDLHLIGTLPEMHLGLMIQTMESVLLVYAFGKSTQIWRFFNALGVLFQPIIFTKVNGQCGIWV